MGEHSSIEWTDATWNPVRARNLATGKLGWHCTHVSEGCRNCYAETFNRRLGTGLDFKPQLVGRDLEVFLDETMLRAPLTWKRPRRIFVGSMSDLFGEFVTDAMLDRIFAVMALCPHHTFQVLSKRAARQRAYLTDPVRVVRMLSTRAPHPTGDRELCELIDFEVWYRPLPNVWHGVSAEDQPTADERLFELVQTPAAVRFVSAEPLLAGIDMAWALSRNRIEIAAGFIHRGRFSPGLETLGRVHLVIAGGESGPHARPMHPDWPRQLRDACAAAGTAFFFKQWGEWAPVTYDAHDEPDFEPQIALAVNGAIDNERPFRLPPHGGQRPRWRTMARVGKKAAGRLLDGREHNAMPTTPLVPAKAGTQAGA